MWWVTVSPWLSRCISFRSNWKDGRKEKSCWNIPIPAPALNRNFGCCPWNLRGGPDWNPDNHSPTNMLLLLLFLIINNMFLYCVYSLEVISFFLQKKRMNWNWTELTKQSTGTAAAFLFSSPAFPQPSGTGTKKRERLLRPAGWPAAAGEPLPGASHSGDARQEPHRCWRRAFLACRPPSSPYCKPACGARCRH